MSVLQEMQGGEILPFTGWFLAGCSWQLSSGVLSGIFEPHLSLSDCSTQALTEESGCVITGREQWLF